MRQKKKFKNLLEFILRRRHEFIVTHTYEPNEILMTPDCLDELIKQNIGITNDINFTEIAGMKIIIADQYNYSESIMFGIR